MLSMPPHEAGVFKIQIAAMGCVEGALFGRTFVGHFFRIRSTNFFATHNQPV
jgi:hypothetical protein